MEEIIKAANLKKVYGLDTPYPKTALNGVSISVNKGTFACIMGTSGSGKTTLINILSTIDEATSGKLLIFDQNIVGLSDKEKANIRKRYMGFIFQDYNLIDSLKVIDNILFSLKLNKKNIINEAEIKQIISSLGIEELLDKYPFECSGGQQQRIAIARAIVNEPKVLLLDEPLGALDLKLRQDMQYELMRLKEELGITFIYITHDQEEALTMSDKIIVMNKGYIQQMGTPEDIYNEPENAFVADFIGDSNIIDGIMLEDRLVEILGTKFPCVDEGFGKNRPVDVVIRPEDVVLKGEGEGIIDGIVTSLIFKGVHYEMEVEANGYEWLVHSTNCYPVGSRVSISVIPFNIQIMHKPESEDEKAVVVDE